jgi:hypothetical protein
MSACAVVAALAGAPALAHADDSVSLVTFQLPNTAAVDQLNRMGADLAESVRPAPNGGVLVDAEVTADQRAQYEALGYRAIATIQDERDFEAVKAERDAAVADEKAAFANLKAGRTVTKGERSAVATDKVQAQRADSFENYAGKFLSIEGYTDAQHVTCTTTNGRTTCAYDGPALTAAWLDASGNVIGQSTLQPFVDDQKYLYHTGLFRVGDPNDSSAMPASVRVASAGGGVDTLPVKQWVSKDGKGFPATFQKDFNTHYVDPQEGYKRISDLAAQYPNIAQIYNLPNQTPGYQRHAQAILGTTTPYDPRMDSLSSAGTVSATDQSSAVVLTSKAWGQDGGNSLTASISAPAGDGQALAVSVSGTAITITPATDGTGKVTSTAAQVVDAINASSAAAALVTADKYNTNAGAGVVAPTATTKLSDFLKAPAAYPRGPQTVKMIEIGTHRTDHSKVGVFIYCQEHAREWATPLVCLETAERLLRNYGTDPETTSLIDNLDIFIVPTINADGAAYSMYDFTSQRKNMVDYCTGPSNSASAPTSRNSWGVDLNRNFSVGSIFDGYEGASATSCTSGTFAGPFEFSEPESRNEQWVQSTFPNIKFAMNVHSYGGYFMWPPGAYKTDGRITLPYPPYGTQQYFDQTASTVLDRVKSYRGTAVLPSRTGPVADVLYSAAGNSADEAYYNHNIIGYDFEIGADRFTGTGTNQTEVGFTPPYANEGHDEGMEFAHGNYGLLDSALDYSNDTTPPTVTPVGPDISATPFDVTFDQSEAAEIRYTTDGSTPTTSSSEYSPSHPRGRPEPIHIGGTTTLRWIATDFKGNSSTGSKVFTIGTQTTTPVGGTVPATLSLTLGTYYGFGTFKVGIDQSYTSYTAATVTSSAGNATLSVVDPSSTAPGHLINGSFVMPLPLTATVNDGAFAEISGTPLVLKTFAGPVSNDLESLQVKQTIRATDPLRTGDYNKTLTFTLSTTAP